MSVGEKFGKAILWADKVVEYACENSDEIWAYGVIGGLLIVYIIALIMAFYETLVITGVILGLVLLLMVPIGWELLVHWAKEKYVK